jgi:hypothetical protein
MLSATASAELAGTLGSDLGALYELSQNSQFVFASPVGPFFAGAHTVYLPRFVFFGPHACDESWRLAFLAGFDHRDSRGSRALVALAARLATDSETGHALNLSFFPLVDVGGLVSGAVRSRLAESRWGSATAPEIALLEMDARQRGYQGFVRVETAPKGEKLIVVRIRGSFAGVTSPDLDLITSQETDSFAVRFESAPGTTLQGPLSIADDLPVPPFELTLQIPGSWSDEAYQLAAVAILERFLRRYRAFQAYGRDL